MGATIDLYRLSDAKYIINGINALSHKEVMELADDEFEKLWATCDIDCWEDGEKHELIDITHYKMCYKGWARGWHRTEKRFSKLPIQRGPVDYTGNIHKHIVADNLGCYSGSILKRRYFRKDTWLVVCTTKQEVVNFFKRYGDKGYEWTMNDILNKWDDKTFLVISY